MDMIPDCVWKEIESVIPKKETLVGRPASDPRRALNGILFVVYTGIQWKYLPRIYGPPSTIHGRLMRWIKNGVFDEIMRIARRLYQEQKDFYGYWLVTDTSHTKAPFAKFSGRNPTDRGKRGVKKILFCDRVGAPLAVSAASSNIHDSKLLTNAVEKLDLEKSAHYRILAADSAFDAKELRSFCKQQGIILVAATNVRRRTNIEKIRPKGREVIERTFGWLAWYRGLKICWNKTIESFVAFLQLASSLQLFRMSGIFG